MADNIMSKAILVGIASEKNELDVCNSSLDELERLLNTAGGEAFGRLIQIKPESLGIVPVGILPCYMRIREPTHQSQSTS